METKISEWGKESLDIDYLHKYLEEIISPLYLVGGSVRDLFLGKEPNDLDFTTPHSPDDILEAFKGKHKTFKEGKRFGTIAVIINGIKIEITTFRNEYYLSGSRKPEVEYVTDINADLGRRDFTINAIARRFNNVIDPYNGINDIKKRLIHVVNSQPHARFKEDPLRMLRACRFASQLDFSISTQTFRGIKTNAHKILEVSKERWVSEIDKILMSDNVFLGLGYLADTCLLNYIIPELAIQVGYDQNSKYHTHNLWNHTKLVVQNSPKDINIRWGALLHDIGKPFIREEKPGRSIYAKHEIIGEELVERLSRHLKFSNGRRQLVKEIVRNHIEDENSPIREADDKAK